MKSEDQLKRGIAAICEKRRISMIDLANNAGVAPSTLYRWIAGKDIYHSTIDRLLDEGLDLRIETVLRAGRNT